SPPVGAPVVVVQKAQTPPAAPALPAKVHLTLSSQPQGASVVRASDGAPLGVTPLSLELSRSDERLPVRFELAGYGPLERSVSLSSDSSVEVALSKVETAKKKLSAKKKNGETGDRDGMVDPFAQ